ncbi:MAG: diguanylate cyclase [Chitinispirillaceae bacterium]|nr:diguanylate cyclase [Chitinispirillaceae bacterium]
MITTIFSVFEIFISVALGIAVFTTPADTLAAVPFIPPLVLAALLLILLLAIIARLRKNTTGLPLPWVFMVTFAAQFLFFLPDSRPEIALPAALLLTMIIGGIGKNYSFIIPFSVFSLAAVLRTLAAMVLSGQTPEPSILLALLSHQPLVYLYLFIAGIVPVILRISYRNTPASTKVVLPPQQTGFITTNATPDEQKDEKEQGKESASGFRQDNHERDVVDLLASVVFFMSRNFRSFSSLGFIYDPMEEAFVLNSFQSKSISIIPEVRIPLGSGIIGRIGSEKKSFMTGDMKVYNARLEYYSTEEHINSLLAVPIISGQDELLGTLVLDSKDLQAFKDLDKETLKRFSSLAAALISTSRMRSIQERSARTFQTFYEASHRFTTTTKPEQIFEVLFGVIPTIAPCNRMIGIMFDQQRNVGQVTNVWGKNTEIVPGFTFPINAGLYSFVFQKRQQVAIGDFQQFNGKYYRFTPDETTSASIRSLLIFPVLDDEQRCRGLFSVESDHQNIFTSEIEQVLTTLMENASVAFIRAVLYQRMERFATTDGLTGLNNHRHFQGMLAQEMERSKRYRRPLALLLMDIDHFKGFNDTYGHPVGDLVLKEIAVCIQKSVRRNDIPARYGGEEFVVIIPETDEKGARITAERIRSTIEQHTIISLDRQLKVTVSIGCSAFPENAPSQQVLIDTADKALYAAKESGRNRVVLYKNGM